MTELSVPEFTRVHGNMNLSLDRVFTNTVSIPCFTPISIAELITLPEGHMIALPLVKVTVNPLTSRTSTERRFPLSPGTDRISSR